jgi:hypothetical protein
MDLSATFARIAKMEAKMDTMLDDTRRSVAKLAYDTLKIQRKTNELEMGARLNEVLWYIYKTLHSAYGKVPKPPARCGVSPVERYVRWLAAQYLSWRWWCVDETESDEDENDTTTNQGRSAASLYRHSFLHDSVFWKQHMLLPTRVRARLANDDTFRSSVHLAKDGDLYMNKDLTDLRTVVSTISAAVRAVRHIVLQQTRWFARKDDLLRLCIPALQWAVYRRWRSFIRRRQMTRLLRVHMANVLGELALDYAM